MRSAKIIRDYDEGSGVVMGVSVVSIVAGMSHVAIGSIVSIVAVVSHVAIGSDAAGEIGFRAWNVAPSRSKRASFLNSPVVSVSGVAGGVTRGVSVGVSDVSIVSIVSGGMTTGVSNVSIGLGVALVSGVAIGSGVVVAWR